MNGKWMMILTLLILVCCADRNNDPRLFAVQSLMDQSPKEVLDSLCAIDPTTLSKPDRHLYDFLKVKVSDKAYVEHTSDSLVLSVIDYESHHKQNGRYPEALYYGGRIYSDLGDYPTAMQYFQDAIDAIGSNSNSNSDNLDLEANIVSQYGRLLTNLRLYEEAIPYIQRSLEIDKIANDTINEIYDLQLLGFIFSNTHRYTESQEILTKALELSKGQPIHLVAKTKVYLADVYLNTGKTDSALSMIRGTHRYVKNISRNTALSVAAKIYLDAGITDSAYLFSRELIGSHDPTNKKNGYQILLSQEMLKQVSEPDTIKNTLPIIEMLLKDLLMKTKI